jgi:hypothetical protein
VADAKAPKELVPGPAVTATGPGIVGAGINLIAVPPPAPPYPPFGAPAPPAPTTVTLTALTVAGFVQVAGEVYALRTGAAPTPVKLAPLPTKLVAVMTPVALIFVDCKLATVETPEEFNCPTNVLAVTIPVALIFVDCRLATVDTPDEFTFPTKLPLNLEAVANPVTFTPLAVKIPTGEISCPLVRAML